MSLPEHHDSSRRMTDEKQVIARKSNSTPSSQQGVVPRIQISIPKSRAVGNDNMDHRHHRFSDEAVAVEAKQTPATVRSAKPYSTCTTTLLSSSAMPPEVSPTPSRPKHSNNNNIVSSSASNERSIISTAKMTMIQPTKTNNNNSDNLKKSSLNNNNNNKDDWPTQSARALPHLTPTVLQRLQQGTLCFPSNAEPCALKLSPTGRLLAVAYNDGTLRLYDLTGRFSHSNHHHHHPTSSSSSSQQQQAVASPRSTTVGRPSRPFVSSKTFQKYGCVAAQIYAKGVHTSLIMDVDVSPDGLWFFCGALRGSMELVAVYVGDLEAELSKTKHNNNNNNNKHKSCHHHDDNNQNMNLLDLVTVYRHSDAKLRGFSACTAIQGSSPRQYLLLTGRGIKNCHVWRFDPSRYCQAAAVAAAGENNNNNSAQEPVLFEKIMDVPTNGNSIKFLTFRRKSRKNRTRPQKQSQNTSTAGADDASNNTAATTTTTTKAQPLLQIVSKSDDHLKVRLWTLPFEAQIAAAPAGTVFAKPSRYYDVPNTESALGVAGAFGLCGGGHDSFNQISIVSLQQQQQQQSNNHKGNSNTDAYCNVMELALPNTGIGSGTGTSSGGRGGSRRSQRGDLKSITSVEGMTTDAGHALLEVSDGSLIHYSSCPRAAGMMPTLQRMESPDGFGPLPPEEGTSRKLTVGRVGAEGIAVAVVATFRSATTKGRVRLFALGNVNAEMRKGFWGFLGTPLRLVDATAAATSAETAEDMKQAAAATRVVASTEAVKERKKVAARTNSKTARKVSEPPAVKRAGKEPQQSDPSYVTPYPSGPDRRLQLLALASTSISKEMRPLARQLAATTPFAKASNKNTTSPDERTLFHITTDEIDERKPSYKVTASTLQKRSVSDTSKTSVMVELSSKRKRLSAEDLLLLQKAKPQDESAGLKVKKRAKTNADAKTKSPPVSFSEDSFSTKAAIRDVNVQQVSTPKPSPNIPRKRPSLEVENQEKGSAPVATAVERFMLPTLVRSPKAASKGSSRKEDSYPLQCIVNACNQQLEQLQTMLNQVVSQRRMISPEVCQSDAAARSLFATERQKLAAEHRAAHDFVWKRVLRVTIAVIKSLKASPTRSALNESRSFLEEKMEEFKDIVEDMLSRQEMEAISLVARQRHELCYYNNQGASPESIPDLEVKFAYPDMLQQALEMFPSPTLI